MNTFTTTSFFAGFCTLFFGYAYVENQARKNVCDALHYYRNAPRDHGYKIDAYNLIADGAKAREAVLGDEKK